MNKNFLFSSSIIIIIVLISIGCILTYNEIHNNEKNTQLNNKKNNDNLTETNNESNSENKKLTLSNYSGTVQVKGYITIEKLTDQMNCSENCPKVNYVYFNIVETDNTNFKEYINNMLGNTFVRQDAIGLGCNLNGIITYYNRSDTNGLQEYKLSQTDSNIILGSVPNSLVTLELERLKFSSGGCAEICYSHITNIKVK